MRPACSGCCPAARRAAVRACALGVASWNRLVGRGDRQRRRPAGSTSRDIPDGAVMIPPRDAVSPELRAGLAGCARVDVVAAAPYFGSPRLLDDRAAWVYHIGAPHGAGAPAASHELVVSDVARPRTFTCRRCSRCPPARAQRCYRERARPRPTCSPR